MCRKNHSWLYKRNRTNGMGVYAQNFIKGLLQSLLRAGVSYMDGTKSVRVLTTQRKGARYGKTRIVVFSRLTTARMPGHHQNSRAANLFEEALGCRLSIKCSVARTKCTAWNNIKITECRPCNPTLTHFAASPPPKTLPRRKPASVLTDTDSPAWEKKEASLQRSSRKWRAESLRPGQWRFTIGFRRQGRKLYESEKTESRRIPRIWQQTPKYARVLKI